MTTALATPPVSSSLDAEVDLEVLKAVPKQFEITSEKEANWLIRKIIAARNYAAHVKEWADRELRRAEREERTLLFLYGRQLEAWTKQEIAKFNGRRKSICLPAGATVGFRRLAARIVIDDEGEVFHWAQTSCPSAIQVIKRLSKLEVSNHFKLTGEVPPRGAHVEPEQERFCISAPTNTARETCPDQEESSTASK